MMSIKKFIKKSNNIHYNPTDINRLELWEDGDQVIFKGACKLKIRHTIGALDNPIEEWEQQVTLESEEETHKVTNYEKPPEDNNIEVILVADLTIPEKVKEARKVLINYLKEQEGIENE